MSHPCKNRSSGKKFFENAWSRKAQYQSPCITHSSVLYLDFNSFSNLQRLTVTTRLALVLSWKHNFTVQLQIFRTFANFRNCLEITHLSWVFVLFYLCYVSEVGRPYGDRASENTDSCRQNQDSSRRRDINQTSTGLSSLLDRPYTAALLWLWSFHPNLRYTVQ